MEREPGTMPSEDSTRVEELFEKLKNYVDTRYSLIKLKSINKASTFTATIIAAIVLYFLLFIVLLLLSAGLALWLGSLLGASWYGFFIVSGFYILIGFVLWVGRKKFLKTPLSNWLIRKLID